ncbi:MAG: LuxR C-terminal-related transcriptional regulator [Pseudomonadales bacterium]
MTPLETTHSTLRAISRYDATMHPDEPSIVEVERRLLGAGVDLRLIGLALLNLLHDSHTSVAGADECDGLTNRELQIVELLAERIRDKEIARRLSISPQTVKSHLRNIYTKLAVSNRRQAVTRARKLGMLEQRI